MKHLWRCTAFVQRHTVGSTPTIGSQADVVELAYTVDSKSTAERHAGSTPAIRTMNIDCCHDPRPVICINRVLDIPGPVRFRLHDHDDYYLHFTCVECGFRLPLPRSWEYHPLAWHLLRDDTRWDGAIVIGDQTY